MTENPHTITVAIDPERHPGAGPESEHQRLTWEALDTAWNLISEYSVRLTLLSIREGAAAAGMEFPSDEEMFALSASDPDAPASYRDLTVGDHVAAALLEEALLLLTRRVTEQAAAALGAEIVEVSE